MIENFEKVKDILDQFIEKDKKVFQIKHSNVIENSL